MKKLAFLSILALGMAFTSCDNYEEPNPAPQTNPQEAVFDINGFGAEAAVPVDELVTLDDLDAVFVAKFNIGETFPAGYELEVVTTMGNDENFTRSTVVPTSILEDTIAAIAKQDLQDALVSIAGKSPDAKKLWFKFAAYAVKGAEKVRIGNPETIYGPFAMTIKPMDTGLVIEENYYLLGTVNGWSVAEAIPFSHSAANVYDDPVFSIIVNITPEQAAEGWWWKIVPESTFKTGNWVDGKDASFGVAENGSEELSGMLVGRTETEDCGAGCLKVSGPYMLKINMMESTYEFTMAIEKLYTPGNSNGWSQGSSQCLTTTDYINYSGYANLDGEFKFTSQADWSGINFGSTGNPGELSTDGGAGNLNAGAAGLYWCQANIVDLTYSLTPVTTIGVIGDFNSWGSSVALTSMDNLVWEGDVTFPAAGGWKFRANNGWDINLGGTVDNLVQGGDNLQVEEAGTYHITLDLSTTPYACYVDKIN